MNYEDEDRGICETSRSISINNKEFRRERSDTSSETPIRSQVLYREESSGSSGSGNPNSRRYGYIYITENLINGKCYIGKRSKSRFDESYKGSGVILRKAFEKYGWENFKTEVIEWCSSKEELNEREIYWIAYYDAVKRSDFYNKASGGEGGNTLVGKTEEELIEYKKKLSISIKTAIDNDAERERRSNTAKRLWDDEDYRRNMSIINSRPKSDETKKKLAEYRGEKASFYGKKHTDEYIKHMSEIHSGGKNPSAKKVVCMETRKIYNTVVEAGLDVGLKRSSSWNICKSCKDGSKSGGYHWRYLDDLIRAYEMKTGRKVKILLSSSE